MSKKKTSKKSSKKEFVPEPRKTVEYMTKYEYALLVTKRAMQLKYGQPPLIETKSIDPIDIAILEISARVIPFKIERVLPNGYKEYWDISEMHIRDY